MKLPAWLSRTREEQRSLENPATPLNAAADWLWDALGARKATAGVSVSPDSALEVTSIWSAVRLISSTLASLPLPVYRHTDAGKEKARNHPVYRLLHDRPNAEQSSYIWREQMLAHLLIYGNYYAEIERNGRGDPVAIWSINPVNVRWQRVGNEKVYLVRVNGEEVALSADSILHIPGFSLDGHTGLVPVHYGREAIGLSKATEAYGSSFFANGAQPSGILTYNGRLTQQAATDVRAKWQASQGGLSNAQRIAVLDADASWHPLGIAPEHAQFIATRTFQLSEVARLFLLPPHLLGDLSRATFSNIESQNISFVQTCIQPWARRIEHELNYKLFSDGEHFAEFTLEGLLRGDSAARAEFYTKMAQLGVYSINEIRERENLNRVEGGDTRFVPLNMTALSAAEQEKSNDEV